MSENKKQNIDLFGNPIIDNPLLRDKFIEPPFSILDTKSGNWVNRKRQWLKIGMKSEVGRDVKTFGTMRPDSGDSKRFDKLSTSIFCPSLCEVLYHWFCVDGGEILDCFAGGSVRGIVANYLGYKYTGIDINTNLSRHLIMYNGIDWQDLGPYIGSPGDVSGFIDDTNNNGNTGTIYSSFKTNSIYLKELELASKIKEYVIRDNSAPDSNELWSSNKINIVMNDKITLINGDNLTLTNNSKYWSTEKTQQKLDEITANANALIDNSNETLTTVYSSQTTQEKINEKINDNNEANNKTYSSEYTNKLYYKTYNEFFKKKNGTELIKIEDSLKHSGDRSSELELLTGDYYIPNDIFDGNVTVANVPAGELGIWENKAIAFKFKTDAPNQNSSGRAINEFTIWLREQYVPKLNPTNNSGVSAQGGIVDPDFPADESLLNIVVKLYGSKLEAPTLNDSSWTDLNSDSSVINGSFWMHQSVCCKSYYRKSWDPNYVGTWARKTLTIVNDADGNPQINETPIPGLMLTDLVQGWTFRAVSNVDNYKSYKIKIDGKMLTEEVNGIETQVEAGLKSRQIFDISLDYKNIHELDYILDEA